MLAVAFKTLGKSYALVYNGNSTKQEQINNNVTHMQWQKVPISQFTATFNYSLPENNVKNVSFNFKMINRIWLKLMSRSLIIFAIAK